MWSLEGLSDDPFGGGWGWSSRGERHEQDEGVVERRNVATQHAVLSQIRFWKYGETSKSVLLLLSSSCVHTYIQKGGTGGGAKSTEDEE